MKLASLKSGRNGKLVVVSDDLIWYVDALAICSTLQEALDGWRVISPKLEALARQLEDNSVEKCRFDETKVSSPLPRAYQWADGSAYVNHVALVRRARNAEMPDSFWHNPLMYQGGSDSFLGPRDDIPLANEAWGCDMEAEVVIVTDDVPMGIDEVSARQHIVLIGLTNDVSLRSLIPDELAKGFGFFHSKPSSAFSPVFVTPDTLGPLWVDGKLHGILAVDLNDQPLGRANAGIDMTFDFGTLIAHAAKTRSLGAGTIIGSGTVSNRDSDGGPGRPILEGGLGYSCLAELRTVETILHGMPETSFMRHGDVVQISMDESNGNSIFGRIRQTVAKA